MKDSPASQPAGDAAALAEVRAHVAVLETVDLAVLDEAAVVDLAKDNRRAVRVLEGQSVSIAARLSDLGGLSTEDVFSTAGRCSTGHARRIQRRGELNSHLPDVVAGFVSGTIPTENLDRIVTARHRLRHNPDWQTTFDGKQASLVRKASRLRPKAFSRYLSELERSLSDDGETDLETEKAKNTLKGWTGADGRYRLSGNFDALTGEEIATALAAEARSLAKQANDTTDTDTGQEPDQAPVHHGPGLDARALVSLLSAGNGQRGRPSINILIDAESLTDGPHDHTVSRTGDGLNLPVSLVEKLLCDAQITFTYLDRLGQPLAVGRNSRTVTDAQRHALAVMYDTCAVCDEAFSRCEIHHIQHWEHGGTTDLDNLIPLCHTHHHRVHDNGWIVHLDPDRTLHWKQPDGTIHQTIPLNTDPKTRHRKPCNN